MANLQKRFTDQRPAPRLLGFRIRICLVRPESRRLHSHQLVCSSDYFYRLLFELFNITIATCRQQSEMETIDISPFTSPTATDDGRLGASQALVRALHRQGYVKIKGHGFAKQEIDEAISWNEKLFGLSTEEKMKAPHPPSNKHHRGYSGISQEKVYTQADLDREGSEALRTISDYKVGNYPPDLGLLASGIK